MDSTIRLALIDAVTHLLAALICLLVLVGCGGASI